MRKLKLILTCLVAVMTCGIAFAQNITVKGVVTDANTGELLPFASVQVKGTMVGAATDEDGNYYYSPTYEAHQKICREIGR